MPGRLLTLEITESVLMESPESGAAMLSRIKQLGIRISVDDFGTGYSCLSLLHQVPIDTLKIDRTFVSRMGAGGEGGETVRTIITLAHSLGIDVVAEGVETPAQKAALEALECSYAQGFFFSKVLDAVAASELIASERRWLPEVAGSAEERTCKPPLHFKRHSGDED